MYNVSFLIGELSMKKEPIRIAQIMGKWVGGGVEATVMNYYRNINRNEIQFDFICDEDSTDIPYEEIESLGGKVIIIPPYQKIFKYIKELKRILKKNNYKIVHSNINTLSVFPLYAAKKAGVPIRIAHSHATSNRKEWKRNIIKNVLRPFSKMYATDYISCSETAGRWLFGNKTFNKGDVRILYNAIDIEKFRFDEQSRRKWRKEYGIDEKTVVIGSIGRLVQTKNHEFIIDVYEKVTKYIPNSKMVIVGQGPLKEKLENKILEKGLSDNVIMMGQRKDVNEIYSMFDLFLLPSLYEGLGLVLIEAQSNGLQCIVSPNVPKEANISNRVEYCNSFDIDEWVNRIKEKNINRYNCQKELKDSLYNIDKAAHYAEDYYIKLYKSNNCINVCHVVSGLISGGVETMIYNYCSYIKKDNICFHILHQHEANPKNVDELNSIGCKITRIPSKRKHPFKNFIETYKYIKKNQIAIIHCHMTMVNWLPLLAARIARVPVRICHSHTNNVSEKKYSERIMNTIFRYLCLKNGNVFLACSDEAGKYLYKNKIKYEIIYNGLNLEKYKYNEIERKRIRQKYNIKEKDFVVGHVGRFVSVKNHKFIIDFFEKLLKENKNYKLMLIGDGELKEIVYQEVLQRGLDKNIIFVGVVPNAQDYYSAFDLLILPSLFEGVPLTIIEAQANGLKCIISDKIDKKAIILKDKITILELNDEKWVKTIKIIKKEYDREINNESFEKNHYNIEKESKKLEKIYLENLRKYK